jgi:hypothetical protein
VRVQVNVPEGYEVLVQKIVNPKLLVDENWVEENADKYEGVNVAREWQKAKDWCALKGGRQKCTVRFFVAWLGRIDVAYHNAQTQADIEKQAKAIKARGWEDAMGWHPASEADAEKLAELRKEWLKYET